MSTSYRELNPTEYYTLHPRPVYLIVVVKPDGGFNVMTIAWLTPVSSDPPKIALSISKDSLTHKILSENGEFTVNILGEEHVDIAYRAGSISGFKVDKWSMIGFKPVESKFITAPGIDGCYGFLECKISNMIDVGECTLFIADILSIHVRSDLVEKGFWNLRKARILLHCRSRIFTIPGRIIYATTRR
ncbi:MAG: flavin reductase family protein [Candidatus Bathyarchaeia archaeon]